jgi:hypothetical protein
MSEIPFRAPRFAPKAGQPFYQELTKRVNAYFTQNNLSPKGNYKLYVKTGVLIGGFLAAYLGLVLAAPGFEVAWMLWLALGLLTAAIGFNKAQLAQRNGGTQCQLFGSEHSHVEDQAQYGAPHLYQH